MKRIKSIQHSNILRGNIFFFRMIQSCRHILYIYLYIISICSYYFFLICTTFTLRKKKREWERKKRKSCDRNCDTHVSLSSSQISRESKEYRETHSSLLVIFFFFFFKGREIQCGGLYFIHNIFI